MLDLSSVFRIDTPLRLNGEACKSKLQPQLVCRLQETDFINPNFNTNRHSHECKKKNTHQQPFLQNKYRFCLPHLFNSPIYTTESKSASATNREESRQGRKGVLGTSCQDAPLTTCPVRSGSEGWRRDTWQGFPSPFSGHF